MSGRPEKMSLEDLLGLATQNHWARADAANGTGAGMFAAYSSVRLALEGYRFLTDDTAREEKVKHAKQEFHQAIGNFAAMNEAFKRAPKEQQKQMLEAEVQKQVAILSLKLQAIDGQ